MPPPNQSIFSAAEIEKMRLYVTEHDKQQTATEFDLNNPPRVNYVHQHFPKVVYNVDKKGNSVAKHVHDAESHEAHIADGWANEPKAEAEPDEIVLDPASAAEAAAIDAAAKKKPAKPVKPAKAN